MKAYHAVPFTTRNQDLFLQAALLKGDDAINAWEEWSQAVDLEGHHDNALFRLMPLLYLNLQHHGIKHPFMNKLKGIYRHTWYENQRLFHDMSKILPYFYNAGVKAMLLNESALIVLDHKNYGVLPVDNMHILVPPHQALLTINLLLKSNWAPLNSLKDGDLFYRNSMEFKDPSGKRFVLHWWFCYGCRTNYDKDFWDGAVRIALGNVSTLEPDPVNRLFRIFVHGVDRSVDHSIQWIAEAACLINSTSEQIDWMRLINRAQKHQFCLRVRDGLNYLHERFQLSIPKTIVNNIKSLPISLLEKIEYHNIMKIRQSQYNTPYARLIMYLCHHLRLVDGYGLIPSIIGFPKYLLWRLNARNYYYLFSNHISKSIYETVRRLIARLIYPGSGRFSNVSKD